ncbi:MAG: hypothetical protein KDI39_14000 [Pseudomonadales bacterium]|nr:hypothetical protein [Pseudomonadales bacterium]
MSKTEAFEQGIHILNEDKLDPLFQATQRIFKNTHELVELAKNKQNCIHAQGWAFEQLETIKFNQDAIAQNRFDIFAATTESMGKPHDPADILIQNKNGKILREVQLKSCENPAKTAFALSDPKYTDMQRVAPSDQHDKIKELNDQRINSGTLKAEDYKNAEQNLSKGVSHDGISSGGTTRQEAIDASDPRYAEQLANELDQKSLLTELHKTGHSAGLMGATVSASFTILDEGINAFNQGNIEISEIVVKVTTNSAKAYLTSYVTAATSRGLAHVAQESLAASSANALVKSNAHIALATSMVKASKSIYKYLTDENMTTEELLSDINHISLTGAGAFYYGALGQIVIPIPVVGALVGSTVGYFIGNLIHQSGLVALGESANVKIARERREQIEKMCLHAIPQMRAERIELERVLHSNQIARREFINDVFFNLESSLLTNDANQYITALTSLNGAFGKDLGFKSLEEFNTLMEDDEFTFKL